MEGKHYGQLESEREKRKLNPVKQLSGINNSLEKPYIVPLVSCQFCRFQERYAFIYHFML